MAFDPKHAAQLKAWLVKRLEALEASSRTDSDVDADILAEYVVALLQHDASAEEARRLCHSELYDFLKDETDAFVEDVFKALALKSYLPGMPQPSKAAPLKPPPPPPPAATTLNPQAATVGYGHGALPPPPPASTFMQTPNGTRKRSYNDSSLAATGPNGIPTNGWGAYNQGSYDRATKQPRRGGAAGRGGRGGGGRGAPPGLGQHGGFTHAPLPQYALAPGTYAPGAHAPGTLPPSTFNPAAAAFQPGQPAVFGNQAPSQPFWLNGNSPAPAHLVENLLRMQEQLAQALSSYNAFTAQATGGQKTKRQKRTRRCRNLDKKGVCTKANCKFDHSPLGAQPSASYTTGDNLSPEEKKASIVVDRIPDEFFNVEQVRNHFSSFGSIVDITLQPEYSTAIVRFDTPAAALKAINSPKTIFDNRFVTVSSLGSGHSGEDYEAGEARDATPELDMEEFLRKQEAAQKDYEEKKRILDDLAEQQSKVDERLKDNLAKQLELRKKIVANMATMTAKLKSEDPQNNGSDDGTTSGTESPGPSKSAAQIMQTELIRAQLATLETEAKLLGIDPDLILGDPSTGSGDDRSYTAWAARGGSSSYGRGGGRGGYAPRGGRGRGGGYSSRGGGSMAAAYAAYTLDNRPRRVAITGADFTDPEKSEALRQYLLGVGDFSAIDVTFDSATITFADRRTAEAFFYGLPRSSASSNSVDSKAIPGIDEPVELGWVAGAVPAGSDNNGGSATQANKDRNGAEGLGPFIMEVEEDDHHDRDPEDGEYREAEEHYHNQTRQRQNMDFDVDDDGDWDVR
ncbi:hypothetical protein SEUCBS139899_005180 [Sporothrix eucalyptigena]|uniref:Uncharacterized protein n=1 Tax=Sporothrix eucalyptigena TaxID=1812306 RepID=A0ABP0AJT8_9PEZI